MLNLRLKKELPSTGNFEFKYLNLNTVYTYSLYRLKTDQPELRKQGTVRGPCFNTLFTDLSRLFHIKERLQAEVTIYANRSPQILKNRNINNLVMVDRSIVEKHMAVAKRLVDFEYKIKTGTDLVINFTVTGTTIQVKFLCAWIRYLYEFPANVFLLDVYRMKRLKEFKDISEVNLTILIDTVLRNHCHIRADQCVLVDRHFINEDKLARDLQRGERYLEDLSELFEWNTICTYIHPAVKNVKTINYWMDKDTYKERLKYYKKSLGKYLVDIFPRIEESYQLKLRFS